MIRVAKGFVYLCSESGEIMHMWTILFMQYVQNTAAAASFLHVCKKKKRKNGRKKE